MFTKRVSLVVGHFGSGKTEIALNGALDLAAGGEPVALVDLDVVKPYFRSRAARDRWRRPASSWSRRRASNLHADLPIIVPQVRDSAAGARPAGDHGRRRRRHRRPGASARSPTAVPADETDCLLVLNFRRPFTPDRGAGGGDGRGRSRSRPAVHRPSDLQHPPDGRDHSRRSCATGYRMAARPAARWASPVVAGGRRGGPGRRRGARRRLPLSGHRAAPARAAAVRRTRPRRGPRAAVRAELRQGGTDGQRSSSTGIAARGASCASTPARRRSWAWARRSTARATSTPRWSSRSAASAAACAASPAPTWRSRCGCHGTMYHYFAY